MDFYNKSILENLLVVVLNEGVIRGKDWCLECDNGLVFFVCGFNWKMYWLVCYVYCCGGFNIENVK